MMVEHDRLRYYSIGGIIYAVIITYCGLRFTAVVTHFSCGWAYTVSGRG